MDLITVDEFADIAATSPDTIRYWRRHDVGPIGFKVGRRVLYERGDVLAWLTEQRDAATERRRQVLAANGRDAETHRQTILAAFRA